MKIVFLGFLVKMKTDKMLFFVQVVMGAWLNAVGAAIRIIGSFYSDNRFIVVMIGQTLAACAQPFLLNSPTKLAANWFGEKERATANMLSSLGELSRHYNGKI